MRPWRRVRTAGLLILDGTLGRATITIINEPTRAQDLIKRCIGPCRKGNLKRGERTKRGRLRRVSWSGRGSGRPTLVCGWTVDEKSDMENKVFRAVRLQQIAGATAGVGYLGHEVSRGISAQQGKPRRKGAKTRPVGVSRSPHDSDTTLFAIRRDVGEDTSSRAQTHHGCCICVSAVYERDSSRQSPASAHETVNTATSQQAAKLHSPLARVSLHLKRQFTTAK
ncbi:uncharacterized protein BCR38DRAFT_408091 [Pseudomassariella vexata]|uniref:Uncharacterized protein n=1 Tax=Pseudomassariella vexata TaxID=1141098 RepID=A0A1Y2E3J3_9PEZI|nr:uncharacterized protein BCR38DRAFT_408091 [Pseudomassariella vexata]ORY66123.1 hypothetical protein BCR38DRAFT_408091 [Pseudomassariella vexata]